ncbi:MAG: hypothetical protein KAQ92_08340 [Candidatus Aenigmarchaeota archaeon]|nr:hypothetical protein [Candidatus Aenigmarchaeota archaeon]
MKKQKKAQFFIITAVIIVLIFSSLFANIRDIKTSIDKQDSSLKRAYFSYINSYNYAIKDAVDEEEVNRNIDMITQTHQKMLLNKYYDLKYSAEFGFFDGFNRERPIIATAGATANYIGNELELDFTAAPFTVDLTYNNLELNINEFHILDLMIKTDNPLSLRLANPASAQIINPEKSTGFVFYTKDTQIGTATNTITLIFTATAPTKATVEYIGLRTSRVIEISTGSYNIIRED